MDTLFMEGLLHLQQRPDHTGYRMGRHLSAWLQYFCGPGRGFPLPFDVAWLRTHQPQILP